MKARMRDYKRRSYFVSPDGEIWTGPYSYEDNLHFKVLGEDVIRASDPPKGSVEITPLQAAELNVVQIREREWADRMRGEGYSHEIR